MLQKLWQRPVEEHGQGQQLGGIVGSNASLKHFLHECLQVGVRQAGSAVLLLFLEDRESVLGHHEVAELAQRTDQGRPPPPEVPVITWKFRPVNTIHPRDVVHAFYTMPANRFSPGSVSRSELRLPE